MHWGATASMRRPSRSTRTATCSRIRACSSSARACAGNALPCCPAGDFRPGSISNRHHSSAPAIRHPANMQDGMNRACHSESRRLRSQSVFAAPSSRTTRFRPCHRAALARAVPAAIRSPNRRGRRHAAAAAAADADLRRSRAPHVRLFLGNRRSRDGTDSGSLSVHRPFSSIAAIGFGAHRVRHRRRARLRHARAGASSARSRRCASSRRRTARAARAKA